MDRLVHRTYEEIVDEIEHPVFCPNCGGAMRWKNGITFCRSCYHVDYWSWVDAVKLRWLGPCYGGASMPKIDHPSGSDRLAEMISCLPPNSAYFKGRP